MPKGIMIVDGKLTPREGFFNTVEINKMLNDHGSNVLGILRRVFPDFPEPVMMSKRGGGLYYECEAVRAWFEKHGVKYQELKR